MGIGSFLAGYLPLTVAMSPERLDSVATMGAGLLIGAVFIVIIPEGVETLYASVEPPKAQIVNRDEYQASKHFYEYAYLYLNINTEMQRIKNWLAICQYQK
jgi:hypothetical protein